MPAISIVVPVYNAEKYLAECAESLLGQTFTDIEILFVDDGSSDSSPALLDGIKAADARARVFCRPHGGVSATRNYGLWQATGRYVLFTDADDFLAPNTCQRLMDAVRANGADIVVFGIEPFPKRASQEDAFQKRCIPPDAYRRRGEARLLFDEPSTNPFAARNLFRREFLIENALQFDTAISCGEDLLFQFMAFPVAGPIVFISDVLYLYRLAHEESAMTQYGRNAGRQASQHLLVLTRVVEAWRARGILDTVRLPFFQWALEYIGLPWPALPEAERQPVREAFLAIMREAGIPMERYRRYRLPRYHAALYDQIDRGQRGSVFLRGAAYPARFVYNGYASLRKRGLAYTAKKALGLTQKE